MQMTRGIIVNGEVVLEDDLPDGTPVVLLIPEGDERLKLTRQEQQALSRAIVQVRQKNLRRK